MDVAIKELEDLIAKNPNNKYYWSQYGDIMMNSGKYDEAIEKYKKALDIDSEFDLVVRNIASAYKNKASVIQKAQADAISKDKTVKADTEKYFPFLRESAKFFEKSRRSSTFRNDFIVLSELANIYTVLQDSKLQDALTELENLEPSIPQESKERYYLSLLAIYGANKMDAKYDQTQKKIENLK